MNVTVYGAGYVGLVSAVCLAKLGHQVICVDIDAQRVDELTQGKCPIHEKELPELLQEQLQLNQLSFTTDFGLASHSEMHIIATGTPGLADGSADLGQVYNAALQVVQAINGDALLIIKSTVPVGTGHLLKVFLHQSINQLQKTLTIHIGSNPEFLREGSAVSDFFNADRIIIGGDDEAVASMKKLYEPLLKKGIPLLVMSHRSAELTKYAANAMLATKISFINHISQLAEKTGANIDEIRDGMALDHRIGPYFLQAGIGYGGSCFPKDVHALIHQAKSLGVDSDFLDAVDAVNQRQKNWVINQLYSHFNGQLSGLKIGLWGLAFKPGTDDLREASSLVAIAALIKAKANLYLYDPAAMPAARKLFAKNTMHWCDSAEDVVNQQLDALLILTEWPEFKHWPLLQLKKKLAEAPVFDGRNCFTLEAVAESGITHYYSVGRPFESRPCKEIKDEQS